VDVGQPYASYLLRQPRTAINFPTFHTTS